MFSVSHLVQLFAVVVVVVVFFGGGGQWASSLISVHVPSFSNETQTTKE